MPILLKKVISTDHISYGHKRTRTDVKQKNATFNFEDELVERIIKEFESYKAKIPRITYYDRQFSTRVNLALHILRETTPNRTGILHSASGMKRNNFYSDNVASGTVNRFVDKLLGETPIAKYFANSHTEIATTGHISTKLLDAANSIIRKFTRSPEDYVVIPTGCGSTAAISEAIAILKEKLPGKPFHCAVSPMEHHSNDLQWSKLAKERASFSGKQTPTGGSAPCFTRLTGNTLNDVIDFLETVPEGEIPVVSLSAGSNVTGKQTTEFKAISEAVHARGGYVFADCAASAPYVPSDQFVDGKFYSPHKFWGGPGTNGILVINPALAPKKPPKPGGGTVDMVTDVDTLYTKNPQHRLVSGTPNLKGLLQFAAIATIMDRVIGMENIHKLETQTNAELADFFKNNERILPNGEQCPDSLPIHSFNIKHPTRGTLLHHNYVAQFLNDYFGIQVRSGCFCAGPYGMALNNVSTEKGKQLLGKIKEKLDILKPGAVRGSRHYMDTPADLAYYKYAINAVSLFGSMLLDDYKANCNTAKFEHKQARPNGVEKGFFEEWDKSLNKEAENLKATKAASKTPANPPQNPDLKPETFRELSSMVAKRQFENLIADKIMAGMAAKFPTKLGDSSLSETDRSGLRSKLRRAIHLLIEHNHSGDTSGFKDVVFDLFVKAMKISPPSPKMTPTSLRQTVDNAADYSVGTYASIRAAIDDVLDEGQTVPKNRVSPLTIPELGSEFVSFEGPSSMELNGDTIVRGRDRL